MLITFLFLLELNLQTEGVNDVSSEINGEWDSMIVDDFVIDDDLLWGLVRKYTKKSGLNTREDLFNEARAAALIACRTFKAEKRTKLTSWVYRCVENRFIHLLRIDATHEGDNDYDEITEQNEPITHSHDDVQFILTMRSLLTPVEFDVFRLKYVEDYNDGEIKVKLGLPRKRVEACSIRILQKYQSLATSLDRTLTMRKLQDKWLDGSRS